MSITSDSSTASSLTVEIEDINSINRRFLYLVKNLANKNPERAMTLTGTTLDVVNFLKDASLDDIENIIRSSNGILITQCRFPKSWWTNAIKKQDTLALNLHASALAAK